MKGISLSSVIQVINLERQSCDIEARADGQTGQLHFRDGALVDAIADDLAGEEAAYAILAWDDPEFQVSTEDSPRDRKIDADLTHLLLETARRQDEENADLAVSPAPADPAPALELVAAAGPAATGEAESLPAGPRAPSPPDSSGGKTHAVPAPAQEPARTAPANAAPDRSAHGQRGALNAAGLKRVVDIARDGLGDALLSADVYSSADGTSYVGVNSIPAGCALMNQITERMEWSLGKSGLPPLGRYYMAELDEAKMMLVAPCGAVQLNLIVDSTRVQLGLLLNVILPEVLSALDDVSPR